MNDRNTGQPRGRVRVLAAQVLGVLSLAAALAPALVGCQGGGAGKQADTETSAAASSAAPTDPVERGKYLVTITGCNDCHTPLTMGPSGPAPDMSRMLSGHPAGMVMPPPPALKPDDPWNWSGAATLTAFAGPWGITYATNLTPDQNTGMGIWTEDMFVRAMRTGRHMGQSRPIMPPMPWNWYGKMTDEDLKAIYAYLRTVPPIENLVPDYMPPAGSSQ